MPAKSLRALPPWQAAPLWLEGAGSRWLEAGLKLAALFAGSVGTMPTATPAPAPAPAAADACTATQYVYDLGCSAGIHIRELAPGDPNLGGAVDPEREAAFHERAGDDITGLSVWASAVMLGRWVQENAGLLSGKDCLELGAGAGLGGLAACVLPAPAAATVCLSDFADATMDNLNHNIGANCKPSGDEAWVSAGGTAVTVAYMDWDQPATWPRAKSPQQPGGAEPEPEPPQQYDVLLGADLLYTRSYARKIANVAAALLRPGGTLVITTPLNRAGYETLLASIPTTWSHTFTGTVPATWRASPFRDVSDAEAALLMPEFAVDAELYPLHYLQFGVPIDAAAAEASGARGFMQSVANLLTLAPLFSLSFGYAWCSCGERRGEKGV